MDKIKTQASKVGELLFAPDTGAAYKKTLTLTWDILRETGLLLWLVICFVFVGGEWFWNSAISLGQKGRTWYEGLSQETTTEPKSAGEIGQSLLVAGENSAAFLLYQAKKQLGIDAEPPQPKVPAPPQASAPKPPTAATVSSAPVSSTVDMPTAPAPTAPAPTAVDSEPEEGSEPEEE
ncbi:hypothetical protein [Leptolyngbya sp. PCC 6406]|uniref:hypothetical protein n=1 Tax=Leptolyngbya sp. PCC 6406 TaxID=1173264 RepID=UPI0002ABE491|nr:hypothetical protein [Leptolyngbya sp. PCC 6406]